MQPEAFDEVEAHRLPFPKCEFPIARSVMNCGLVRDVLLLLWMESDYRTVAECVYGAPGSALRRLKLTPLRLAEQRLWANAGLALRATLSSKAIRETTMKKDSHWIERFSHRVMIWTGSTPAFAIAVSVVLLWAITGPLFHFSDTWQLVINTGTTVVTFLMVFLIQRAQNKDSKAVALKLNEILASIDGASNRLIDLDDLDEQELDIILAHYAKLSKLAQKDDRLTRSHSIDEAEVRHTRKHQARAGRP